MAESTVGSPSLAFAMRGDVRGTLHVAVVHAGCDICLLTAAPTRALLMKRLAGYARDQAPLQLRSPDAGRVAALAALGRHEDVVAHYFRAVGEKWDHERLVVTEVSVE
jgi:hypothetical protein